MTDDRLSVDDIVTGRAAEELGQGVIPTRAMLIVETISTEDDGRTIAGLRYILSEGTAPWQMIGPLRSCQLKLEADDLACWATDDEEDQ